MTNFKTLFVSALLCSVAALSFAKAPAASKNGDASTTASPTATTGSKSKVKASRHKSARPAKSKSQARHAASKQKIVRDSKTSNSKGPGLEAY